MGTRTSWTALAASGVLAAAVSWAAPASALIDPLVVDIDPPDTEAAFFTSGTSNQGWTGSDTNPADNLDNNSETTEGNYLSALLGFVESDPDRPQLITRITSGSPIGDTSVAGFDPGFDWTYAVVKVGTGQGDGHNFFQDDGDGVLMTGSFQTAISHITFFTPIPAAAWMLLTGLAAFFGLRWRQRRNEAAAAA